MALLEQRITERAAQNERVAAGKSLAEAARELLLAADRDVVSEQGWAQLLVEFRAHAARDPALNRRYADAHRRTVAQLAALLARLHDQAGTSPAVPVTVDGRVRAGHGHRSHPGTGGEPRRAPRGPRPSP